jgi:hypothetical protein
MNVAIKMAKSYMTQIRRYLVEEGLRSPEGDDSAGQRDVTE